MGAHGDDGGYEPDDKAAAEARAALVREIEAKGALSDPAWRAAFADVPRHVFVPYYFVPPPRRLRPAVARGSGRRAAAALAEGGVRGRRTGDPGARR